MLKRDDEIKDETNEKKEKSQTEWMPICMCFGLSIGMGLGKLLFDNLSLGMCFGVSMGVAVGSMIDAQNRKKNTKDKVENKTDEPENKIRS